MPGRPGAAALAGTGLAWLVIWGGNLEDLRPSRPSPELSVLMFMCCRCRTLAVAAWAQLRALACHGQLYMSLEDECGGCHRGGEMGEGSGALE